MENVNIYELKSAANDMMRESEEIINYAIKQTMDLDHLGYLDSDDLKAYASMKHVFDAFKKYVLVAADASKEVYERQKEIDRKLDKINEKLDKLVKDE